MNVNFIITCCNREAYWPYLRKIILSYKQVVPHIAFCYNGKDKNMQCDFRAKNEGLTKGDTRLLCGGYNILKGNGVNHWMKLSVDSWLCREQVIVDLFMKMDFCGYHYAGIPWKHRKSNYSTDIIFADTVFMQVLVALAPRVYKGEYSLEGAARRVANSLRKVYFIPERLPYKRHHVEALGWTMQHNLKKNVEAARKFGAPI